MVRQATKTDMAEIRDIYNYYVKTTTVSFEEEPVSEDEMISRMEAKTAAGFPWLVYEEDGSVLGYAYAGRWKERSAYRYCAETTVYVKNGLQGKGIGSALYAKLLKELRANGLHTVMAVITLPNEASRALHERFGFQKSACFKEVGYKFDRWLDVGYWELLL